MTRSGNNNNSSSSAIPSRRRQRNNSMTSREGNDGIVKGKSSEGSSFVNSKAMLVGNFVEATRRSVSMLMKEHGYSRERAAATLRNAIVDQSKGSTTRGEETATTEHYSPSDMEVFDAMRLHGVGVDEASSILTISRAVRDMTIRGRNTSETVVQQLIEQVTHVCVPTTPTVSSKQPAHAASSNSSPLVMVRMLPIVQQASSAVAAAAAPSVVSQSGAPSSSSVAAPSNATSSASISSPRKEKRKNSSSTDATKSSPSVKNPRPRADSLAEVVSDKLSASSSAAASTEPALAKSSVMGKPPMAPLLNGGGVSGAIASTTSRSAIGVAGGGTHKRMRSASDEGRSISSPLNGTSSNSSSNNGSSSKRSRRSASPS